MTTPQTRTPHPAITLRAASRLYYAHVAVEAADRPIDKKTAIAGFNASAQMISAFEVGNTGDHVAQVFNEVMRGAGERPLGHPGSMTVRHAYDTATIALVRDALTAIDRSVPAHSDDESPSPATTPDSYAVAPVVHPYRQGVVIPPRVQTNLNPQTGDVAYFTSCVEGGDPYRVTVTYRHATGGWHNIESGGRLDDDHPGLADLHLLVRDHHAVAYGLTVARVNPSPMPAGTTQS